MRRIAMRFRYDGTDYHGWQRQKNGVTVQQKIEEALSELTGEEISVTGCSRTDAGVHALDYVLHFDTDTGIPVEKLPYALNYRLKDDITAIAARQVAEDFHARFSAQGKQYVYHIWNGKQKNPFLMRYSWYVPYDLDVSAMQKAAPAFVGTHDFAGFMAAGGSQKTTVRTVRICEVVQHGEQPEWITVTVEADAFLYNMVRIMVGTLAEIGFGKIRGEDLPQLIAACDRKRCGLTAPPEGLFLKKVYYSWDENDETKI